MINHNTTSTTEKLKLRRRPHVVVTLDEFILDIMPWKPSRAKPVRARQTQVPSNRKTINTARHFKK